MIAPQQHRSPGPRVQPDQWHPDPQAYRPPDSGKADYMATVQEKIHSIGSKHPVWVVAAAASIGALLGYLVKRR